MQSEFFKFCRIFDDFYRNEQLPESLHPDPNVSENGSSESDDVNDDDKENESIEKQNLKKNDQ